MKIRTHGLTLDDGHALPYLPRSHAGTRVTSRVLVVHYTAARCGRHAPTPEQVDAILAHGLTRVIHYGRADVPGYDDIAPGRKRDPGPDFPPDSVRARPLGALSGTPLPLGTEVGGVGELNGVTDIVERSHGRYPEAIGG